MESNKHDILTSAEEAPYVVLNEDSNYPVLLVCDHASNRFPLSLDSMKLDQRVQDSHLAIDIGARNVTCKLAKKLNCTAVICEYSRLVIDCNRDLNDIDIFLQSGDGVVIEGNHNLSEDHKRSRAKEIYWPYHNSIEAEINRLALKKIKPLFVSIHSFTPKMDGQERPWELGVLWHKDEVTARHFLREFSKADFSVGDNQPYTGKGSRNFTIQYHAEKNNLSHVSIEMRQDIVSYHVGLNSMTELLGDAIKKIS